MVPQFIKIGDTIYINLFGANTINKYIYLGDGHFTCGHTNTILKNLDLATIPFSFSEDSAKCKAYLYKLNKLQKLLDEYVRKTKETEMSIDMLNEEFKYLKINYPEEFI